MIALVIFAALVLCGGVSVAAENAVPGDALYTVKTSVNENVRAAIAVSKEADARWDARAAGRRLDEAAELSARGSLSTDVAADLSSQFESHAEAALKAAGELAAEGNTEAAADVAAEIDATLKAHADLLESAHITGGGVSVNLSNVLNAVRISASGNVDGGAQLGASTSGSVEAESNVSGSASSGEDSAATSETSVKGSLKVDLDL